MPGRGFQWMSFTLTPDSRSATWRSSAGSCMRRGPRYSRRRLCARRTSSTSCSWCGCYRVGVAEGAVARVGRRHAFLCDWPGWVALRMLGLRPSCRVRVSGRPNRGIFEGRASASGNACQQHRLAFERRASRRYVASIATSAGAPTHRIGGDVGKSSGDDGQPRDGGDGGEGGGGDTRQMLGGQALSWRGAVLGCHGVNRRLVSLIMSLHDYLTKAIFYKNTTLHHRHPFWHQTGLSAQRHIVSGRC